MQSNNPVLKRLAVGGVRVDEERMTVNGTIAKTALLLVLAVVTAAWTWHKFTVAFAAAKVLAEPTIVGGVVQSPAAVAMQAGMSAVSVYLWGGLIVGFIFAMISTFKPRWAHVTAPLYALAEGCALGGLSAFFEARFPGIVIQAIMATGAVLVVMLVAYRTGLIHVTDKFRKAVVIGTVAIMALYFVEILLTSFTSTSMSFINGGGVMGIGFSILVVGLAALNLVLDFDVIDQGAAHGAPKYMEWYGAFALMITLVWLYIELLRLLAKTRR